MAGFKKAKGEQAFIKMGIYGASGSGKTFTSLLIAEGLAKIMGKRIAMVDTEHGSDFYCQAVVSRKIHPEAFDFDALYTKGIVEISQAVSGLDDTYGVIIIDSITHIWESAKNAFDGKLTKISTIPMQAWGKIKKPYKDLINNLLSCNKHVILCGRQGNEFAEDEETGELKNIGYKMKAEGETPYEPHILIRLETCRERAESHPVAFIEKDRTGVLSGKSIAWPCFDNVAKPILPLLGGKQADMQSIDETSQEDAEKIAEMDLQKEAKSNELYEWFSPRFKIANSLEAIESIAKEITKEVKAQMLTSDTTKLKEEYLAAVAKYKRSK